MKLLELFSGTGSVGEPFRRNGNEVISVDIDGRFGCEIQEDILQFAYVKIPWIPDILWASPPCTEYSRAKTRGKRDLKLADSLVAKFIEIRDYFLELNPSMLWFCENGTGTLLWDRSVAETLYPRVTLSYCQYNGPGYRKNTTIATNAPWTPKPKCDPKTCKQVRDGRHILSAQQGPEKIKGKRAAHDKCSRDTLHKIPDALCEEIYNVCLMNQWFSV